MEISETEMCIRDRNVGGRSVTANTFFAGFTSPVDIDEDEKELLLLWLNSWSVSCPIPFLNLEI